MLIELYPPQWAEIFEFYTVSVSRFMDCYPTTISKNVLLWLLSVTSNEPKMRPLKVALPSLGVYYAGFNHDQREGFFVFCK